MADELRSSKLTAIYERNSVRKFTDQVISEELEAKLRAKLVKLNKESGLNLQHFTQEAKVFANKFYHYGRFQNCKNYLALLGKKGMDEEIGYYGEKFVIYAQELGLNSCWVGLTYNMFSGPWQKGAGEKLYLVIALGYGVTAGVRSKSKEISQVSSVSGEMPDWFRSGVEAALRAPTSVNQQKFHFSLSEDKIVTASTKRGIYAKLDLGIAKYHFEVGAGDAEFTWK